MSIIFENIDTGESAAIDRETGGNYYRAKLAALINSSNLGINHDRGQDYGWRLKPEQQVIIEQWEEDPEMIDKVSAHTRVPVDSLAHGDFLSYFLYQEELGKSPEKAQSVARRDSELEYARRVAALKALEKPETLKPFVAPVEVEQASKPKTTKK